MEYYEREFTGLPPAKTIRNMKKPKISVQEKYLEFLKKSKEKGLTISGHCGNMDTKIEKGGTNK